MPLYNCLDRWKPTAKPQCGILSTPVKTLMLSYCRRVLVKVLRLMLDVRNEREKKMNGERLVRRV